MIGETRWDDKAGLRRDAVRSQVTKEPRPGGKKFKPFLEMNRITMK
jgi:hypothetical protein